MLLDVKSPCLVIGEVRIAELSFVSFAVTFQRFPFAREAERSLPIFLVDLTAKLGNLALREFYFSPGEARLGYSPAK